MLQVSSLDIEFPDLYQSTHLTILDMKTINITDSTNEPRCLTILGISGFYSLHLIVI